jgi:hypothetical protein
LEGLGFSVFKRIFVYSASGLSNPRRKLPCAEDSTTNEDMRSSSRVPNLLTTAIYGEKWSALGFGCFKFGEIASYIHGN